MFKSNQFFSNFLDWNIELLTLLTKTHNLIIALFIFPDKMRRQDIDEQNKTENFHENVRA